MRNFNFLNDIVDEQLLKKLIKFFILSVQPQRANYLEMSQRRSDLLININNYQNFAKKPSKMSELCDVPARCSKKNMYLRSEIQCLGIYRFLLILIHRDKDRYSVTWDSALQRKLHLSTMPALWFVFLIICEEKL